MKYKFISTKIGGGVGNYGKTYEFFPQDEKQSDLRGDLAILVFFGDEDESREKLLVEDKIANLIFERYYSDLETTSFSCLKNCIFESIQRYSHFDRLEIAATSLVSNAVNIFSFGGAGVRIVRNGLIIDAFKNNQEEISGLSGYATREDIFLLGSKSFFENYPTGVIRANLSGKDLKEAREHFSSIEGTEIKNRDYLALILKVVEEINYAKEVPVPFELGDEELKKKAIETKNRIPIFAKLTQPLKNKGNIFSRTILNIRKKNFYVQKPQIENQIINPRKKTTLNIGVILLVLLSVSIFFGLRERKQRVIREKYNQEISDIKHNLEEAQNLYTVSPDRSRQLFSQARERGVGLSTVGAETNQIEDLKKELKDREGTILREFRKDANLFVDLGLVSEGFRGNGMVFSDNKLYLYDKNEKKVALVSVDNKNTRIILGPHQVNEFDDVAVYSDRLFIVKGDGIFELDNALKKIIDSDWQNDVLIEAYAGNIYLLDKSRSSILRYSGSEKGFLSGVNWLSKDITIDLTRAKNMAIDGMIWILKEDGGILKMNMGNIQKFEIVSNETNFVPISFYTDEKLANLYILDGENKSIFVFSKDGSYVARYISDEINSANSLIASEESSKIFFLKEGKIFVIEMEN